MYGSTSTGKSSGGGTGSGGRIVLLNSNTDDYGGGLSSGGEVEVDFLVDYDAISKRIEKNNDLVAYNIPQISKLLSKLGTGQDSSELRLNMRNLLSNTKKMMKENTLLLKKIRDSKIINQFDASYNDNSNALESEKKRRKINVDKMNTTFQIWLKKFNEVSEQVTTKERTYQLLLSSSSSLLTPLGSGSTHASSSTTGLNPFTSSQDDDSIVTRGVISGGSNNATAYMQPQQHEEVFSDLDRITIEEREKQVKEVHKSMVGLNQVMIDMSTLVHDQENDIQSIEEHITNSVSYTTKGLRELQKAEEHQKESKSKTCCIVGVIILIVVCACLLLALSLTPA
eukprot:TRINITY_DN7748_c0_g1_i2.p1 TRINITY_DN7748_c0_g1~~TRINITY_DN7748_c0_g1_i2.p1  ORF type:complete len:340 (+),score=96.61 TRINITY_DN7748_c0_g1_i2:128-1147(+)